MKSYGYKLINYVFSVAVYDLLPPLNQFVDAVLPKISGSGIEEFVEPVFKVLFIIEGNAHMVRQRAEKIVICGCKVRRMRRMLKDLPFELLKCSFDDLCNMRPGVVVKKYGLALSMGSFPLNSLIHTMPSQSHQMQIMVFLGWRSGLTLVFGISRGATHSFLCFIFIYRHHFSSPVTIRYKKLFVIACCSMVGEILRSNMKAIFFVVFTKLIKHPDSQFFSKIPLNEDDWESFFDCSLFFWPIHDLYDNFSPSKVLSDGLHQIQKVFCCRVCR